MHCIVWKGRHILKRHRLDLFTVMQTHFWYIGPNLFMILTTSHDKAHIFTFWSDKNSQCIRYTSIWTQTGPNRYVNNSASLSELFKYTNPARGILDFCKQKFYRPLPCSPWTLYTLCNGVRTLHSTPRTSRSTLWAFCNTPRSLRNTPRKLRNTQDILQNTQDIA